MSSTGAAYTLPGVLTQDEGNTLGNSTILNFTGAGVTASISGSTTTVNIPGGGGGGGAPVDAQYLTLIANGTLTQERVFTPSANFLVVDGGAGGNYQFDLSTTGVAAGAYTNASVTVDAKGRVTAAASGAAPVTSVSVDAGELTNTGSATAPVLGLANTTVGAGSYTNANITVDGFGRITAAANGAAGTTDHTALSNLAWNSSAHTGQTTAVPVWQGNANTPEVLQATTDETMLVRRGGVLQWVPIPVVALVSFSGLAGQIPADLSLGGFAITAGVFA